MHFSAIYLTQKFTLCSSNYFMMHFVKIDCITKLFVKDTLALILTRQLAQADPTFLQKAFPRRLHLILFLGYYGGNNKTWEHWLLCKGGNFDNLATKIESAL